MKNIYLLFILTASLNVFSQRLTLLNLYNLRNNSYSNVVQILNDAGWVLDDKTESTNNSELSSFSYNYKNTEKITYFYIKDDATQQHQRVLYSFTNENKQKVSSLQYSIFLPYNIYDNWIDQTGDHIAYVDKSNLNIVLWTERETANNGSVFFVMVFHKDDFDNNYR
jgi:hypothetical protein